MLTRIITAVVCIPLVIFVILQGNPVLQFTIMALSLIALYEFFNAIKEVYHPIKYIGYGTVIIYYLFLDQLSSSFNIYLGAVILIALVSMVIHYPKHTIQDVAMTLFGSFYISILFSFFVLVGNTEYGDFWIWLIMLSAWGSDTFAYFVGRGIGKNKLTALSPNKTIEGSIGGVVGAGLLAYLYTLSYTYFHYNLLREYTLLIVGAAMIAAIISQFGDLAASAIKRNFNKKDFGFILPGHGGILDRFDSLLFTAPVIYIAVIIVENVVR